MHCYRSLTGSWNQNINSIENRYWWTFHRNEMQFYLPHLNLISQVTLLLKKLFYLSLFSLYFQLLKMYQNQGPCSSSARCPLAPNFCSCSMRKSLAFSKKSYPGHPGFLRFKVTGYLQYFLDYDLGIAALNQLDMKHTESTPRAPFSQFLSKHFHLPVLIYRYLFTGTIYRSLFIHFFIY